MTSRWNNRSDVPRGDDYDARWRALAEAGESIHGEADFICGFEPASVLDAGCGTGRVAIELARRGIDVVGVDLDPGMLDTARAKDSAVVWHLADLATVRLGRTFDVVAMPGNVMIFVEPGSEGAVVANMAAHLAPGGRLVAGFRVDDDRLSLEDYDAHCAAVGLEREQRWATWDREPYAGGDYAVSVHAVSVQAVPAHAVSVDRSASAD